AARAISGTRTAFGFLLDDVVLPRSLELGCCFFDFVWAEGLLVVCGVDDLSVDCDVDDLPVDWVVDDCLRVFDDCPGGPAGGAVVDVDAEPVVVVVDDPGYWSVTWMLRCPSSESELPSL